MTTKELDIAGSRFTSGEVVASPEETTTTSNTAPLIRCPPDDPATDQSMRLIEEAGILDFWGNPEEDGYSESDGEPL